MISEKTIWKEKMRFAHSRFHNNEPVMKGEEFDRVVTTAWTFEPEVSILTYGATVYKKSNAKDFWSKREHIKTAKERFENNPIRVQLKSKDHNQEIDNIAMDWYIASNLIFKFGTHNTNQVDVRRIHGEVTISPDFNQDYSFLNYYYCDTSTDCQELGPTRSDFYHFLIGLMVPTLSYLVYSTIH